MTWTVYYHLRLWPIPSNQQHLTHEMLGLFEIINGTFKSSIYGPAKAFGNSVMRNVGQFNSICSIFLL
jgi:hypothetical protein